MNSKYTPTGLDIAAANRLEEALGDAYQIAGISAHRMGDLGDAYRVLASGVRAAINMLLTGDQDG